MPFEIKKSQVEKYEIRGENTWADIIIDANEKAGRIQIASDFGSWQNYWNACGESFKKFLIGLDIHYAANKFGAHRWFDSEGTVNAIREVVKQQEKDLGKEKSFRLYELCDSLSNSIHKEEFIVNLQGELELMELFDGYPEIVYDLDPGYKHFWSIIWPEFVEELKKETANA